MRRCGPWNTTIVLRDVDVRDPVARTADRVGGVLLFDVRVESVEMKPAVRMPDIIDQADPLVESVQVVKLETVDDLFRKTTPEPARTRPRGGGARRFASTRRPWRRAR